MSAYDGLRTISLIAGEDLSSTGLHRFGVINSSGQVVKNTTAQGTVDVVIAEAVDAAGKVTQCIIPDGGIAKVMAGAAFSAGALISSDNVGRAITHVASVGNVVVGRAIEAAAAAGDIVKILFSVKAVNGGS